MYDLATVRQALPLLNDVTYLNCGTLGLTAEPVLAVLHDALDRDERGGHWATSKLGEAVEASRRRVATWMGCTPEEIAFSRNASDGVNFIMAGLKWHTGEEVLISDQEHPAILYPAYWLQQQKGVQVRLFRVEPDPQATLRNVEQAITSRTRLIAVSHISCLTGSRLPAKEICTLAHERGILSLVDGAQSLAHIPVNVQDIGADFYVGNGHKWLCAPKGTGFLYIRRQLIADLWPMHVGAGCEAAFSLDAGLTLKPDASRFEFGSIGLGPLVAIAAALDWLEGLGWQAIETYMRRLTSYLRERLPLIKGVTVLSPMPWEWSSALTSFTVMGWNAQAVQQKLWHEHTIVTRYVSEYNALRLSTAYYNSEDDIDRLLAALQRVLDM